MRLVASLLVRNEIGRYLKLCIGHLAEFCEEIRVVDDASTDHTFDWLADIGHPVDVLQLPRDTFFRNEAAARQEALEWTVRHPTPTHVLAIDADEFVADGQALRRILKESAAPVFNLCMEEVWKASAATLAIRVDGGWRPTWSSCLWRVPHNVDWSHPDWRIRARALACGREPVAVRHMAQTRQAVDTEISLFHFGWANESERAQRYERYQVADGGRFHASSHLASIMWPDEQVRLEAREWPEALTSRRPAILGRANPQ